MAEKFEDRDWDGGTADGLAVIAVAHMEPPEEVLEESLLVTYILLLLLVLVQLDAGSADVDLIAPGDGLGGGTPQSDLLPQMMLDDCD